MSNKKYHWLKLNEDFFEEDTIRWIEEHENGKEYVIYYLKLVLKSLKHDGNLIRHVGGKPMPYDMSALSRLTNTPINTVKVAMEIFEQIGLVTRLETGEICIAETNKMKRTYKS